MAIRIEYLLLLVLGILLLSTLGIKPASHEATSSKGDKEIAFENFHLSNIKENESTQEMSAQKTVKYQNYLEMQKLEIEGESTYHLLATRAKYQEQNIYMEQGIQILRDDGLKFVTKEIHYNIDTKDIKGKSPFVLEFNSSKIKGENLQLNMQNKVIRADKVEAHIVLAD